MWSHQNERYFHVILEKAQDLSLKLMDLKVLCISIDLILWVLSYGMNCHGHLLNYPIFILLRLVLKV